ncbi:NADH dehydrogenase subunit L [Bacillus oleivorans]|uniref:NADH dehydrogenase subunit L n=1 Tax=Bacillus oleivorans TaxID=1448271 RepID=A0A285CJ31_9BACI|nr:NADH-quinone oxidoreductase subunit L [Bacillus oleivorans]SNX66993.1 NADH dehydrogenase subunit L [Bacillus oleivorans]
MMEQAWLIPLIPLVVSILLLMIGKTLGEASAYIGISGVFVSFLLSLFVLIERFTAATVSLEWEWFTLGDIILTAGIEVTALNSLMLFVVSIVSLLVHIYAKGYMHGEERFSTFYAYLSFFTFAMLALVISPNLLQIYIFWELVGLGSFLLIGFYYQKQAAKQAAKKAFIMTRIGDVALLAGIILLYIETGSFRLTDIYQAAETGLLSGTIAILCALLIFIGAVGKSGQFPLHTWLPDAMEGPTPVSALIHAATMVAAGVYLVAILFPLFSLSETAMYTVSCLGGFTAIFAASIALVQNDIKRVLAYSTVSQLGYMMLALGSGGFVAAVFHLTTHAFFKALLFLAAGSVIHATGTQDIREMGGLKDKLKSTGPLFLIGTLAITGVPLLSGFFSKDEILLAAWSGGYLILFVFALVTTFLTGFYMFRLYFLVFHGKPSVKQKKVHESPNVMVVPMAVLAFFAIFIGYIQTPWFGHFLGDWLIEGTNQFGASHAEGPLWIMLASIFLSLGGIGLAFWTYGKGNLSKETTSPALPLTMQVLQNKYYIDEIYEATIIRVTRWISLLLQWIDRYIVSGIVRGIAVLVVQLGRQGAKWQTGQVQWYGSVAFLGLAVLLAIYMLTGGVLK